MSPLQRDVFKTLLYFDIFNHPLRPEEIYRFLPSNSTTAEAVERACTSEPLLSIIRSDSGFYSFRSNPWSTSSARLSKEYRAAKLLKIASLVTAIITRVPFVRAVGLSGELAKGVASEEADIDFFVVTASERLWICRSMLIALKKILLFNSKKYFCLNHFVSEDRLPFDERNIYTAIEIVTIQPVSNHAMISKYKRQNNWVHVFLPNAPLEGDETRESRGRQSGLQKFLEKLIPSRFADWLDGKLMDFWRRVWKKRYHQLTDAERNRLFRCTAFLSTAYGTDFLHRILKTYNERLESFHLPVSLIIRQSNDLA